MNVWRKLLISGGIGAVLMAGSTVHALTKEEILAKLQVLYQAVATIQAQIEQRSGTGSTSSSCLRLSSNLKLGMSDSVAAGPVSALQRFLKGTGDYTYPEITGYFGAATRSALQAYQARSGIVSSGTPETTGYGAAGPRTRQHIETATCTIVVAPPPPTTPPPPDTGSCVFNNQKIMNGAYIQLYSLQTVPVGQSCISYSANRQCVNGSLSGSDNYKYVSCVGTVAKSCKVGSLEIEHDGARTFYDKAAVSSGDKCSAHTQSRKCTDGVLSGTTAFSFTACDDPKSCTVDGATVADGNSRDFYFLQHVPAGEQCSAYVLSRSCANGVLGGDATYKYSSCAPIAAGSCTVDNVVLTTGNSATFYSAAVAPAGQACSSIAQVRSCTNGTLSGSATFNRASCSDTQKCTLDGITMAHASSTTFYSTRLVGFGTTCASVSQLRTCTNAKLSGSDTYKYALCSVAPPSSCTLDGKTILTGSSDVFYKERTVASGSLCNGITRTCTNAVLSGDAAYQYAACEVTAATPNTGGEACPYGQIRPADSAGCK